MVRKTGRTGHARRKARNKKKDIQKQKDSTSIGEFNFRFEDEQLQQRYKTAWEEYNKVLPNFPMPKEVGYIQAVSLVRGKQKKNLDDVKNVFTRTDDLKGDVEALHHKNTVIDDVKKSIQEKSVDNYITDIKKKFKRIGGSNPHKRSIIDIINDPKNTRYNYVYYKDHPKQRTS